MAPAEGPLALVEVAQLSDTGRVRHHNEDRSVATPDLLAVADGMGGAKAGEVAAQVAVEAVAALGPEAGADEVRTALENANRAIRRMARDDPDKSGMGTTMTAAMLRDGRLDVVHVGDSRAYLWRGSTLSQITEDHSVVAELVRRGSITAEEAEIHPHRNVITRALGRRGRGPGRPDDRRPARGRRRAGVQRRPVLVRPRGRHRRGARLLRRPWPRPRAPWWRAPTTPAAWTT